MTLRQFISALIVPILIGGVWWFTSKPAEALTLVPPSLEFSVQPGQSQDGKIKLFNEETDPISIFTSTSNFTARGEGGEPNFDFAEELSGLADWIDIGAGPFTLQPQDRIEIPFTINVPANAEPGGHYASIFFGTDPSITPEDGGQVSIRSLIGSLVILRVAGDVREQASVVDFTSGEQKTYSRLPVNLDLRMQNSGNVHVRPQGTIVIKNLFGGETAKLTFNEANGAVLPDSVRKFTTEFAKGETPSETGNFFTEIGREWSNFALGPYTATATITYGQSSLTFTASTKFSVWPWRLLTVGVALIVLIVLILTVGIKGYNRAIINRAQKTPPPGAAQ